MPAPPEPPPASVAPRRSTSAQVTFVKSAPLKVLPANRTRVSFAPPKSASRSTQSSNATSVSEQSRKFTESSLQFLKLTRRKTPAKACTPASTHPLNHTSVHDDSAMSRATNRVSENHTSDMRARRSRPPSKVTPVNADSANRDPPATTSENAEPLNRTRS